MTTTRITAENLSKYGKLLILGFGAAEIKSGPSHWHIISALAICLSKQQNGKKVNFPHRFPSNLVQRWKKNTKLGEHIESKVETLFSIWANWTIHSVFRLWNYIFHFTGFIMSNGHLQVVLHVSKVCLDWIQTNKIALNELLFRWFMFLRAAPVSFIYHDEF